MAAPPGPARPGPRDMWCGSFHQDQFRYGPPPASRRQAPRLLPTARVGGPGPCQAPSVQRGIPSAIILYPSLADLASARGVQSGAGGADGPAGRDAALTAADSVFMTPAVCFQAGDVRPPSTQANSAARAEHSCVEVSLTPGRCSTITLFPRPSACTTSRAEGVTTDVVNGSPACNEVGVSVVYIVQHATPLWTSTLTT